MEISMTGEHMAGPDYSVIVAIGSIMAALAAGTTVLAFWMRFSDRITKAEARADSALQEAAEAKNENENLREAMAALSRDHGDIIENARREQGESLSAIRQHVTELAMFVRDNFVRTAEFSGAMTEIKAGQLRLETKLDRMSEHMRPK